ncbi:MAG TPA: NDP-sugar synthase [Armatimonadota bacterium]|nr:NDP-sugar synthase [Armatimonadota bacterium]HPP76263.1 NDP-sugar synthase [Armatimonadota bacterium]
MILAGGRGTRLHPLTMSTPKPLLPLFSKPVMEHTIELLCRHGIREIIVALSSQAHEIAEHFGDGSKWGVNIRYSLEDEPRGTAGAVKMIQPYIDGRFLVVSGDAITDFDLTMAVDYHKRKSAIATMLLHQVEDPADYGIVQQESDGRISRFLEKPKYTEIFSNIINSGIYILEPEALSSIPYFTAYDFARDLFPRMLRNLEPIYGCLLPGFWCDVGNVIQYRNAHFDALTGKAQLDITGTEVEPGVWIGEEAEIHHTAELAGPLFLGTGAEVRKNAALKPFAVVGENSLVDEAATVARSIVGSRALIGKGTRVTDCVIGCGYQVQELQRINNRVIQDDAHIGLISAEAIAPVSDSSSIPV